MEEFSTVEVYNKKKFFSVNGTKDSSRDNKIMGVEVPALIRFYYEYCAIRVDRTIEFINIFLDNYFSRFIISR